MADIATNTLQIGGNNLILQDAAVRSSLANAYSASSTYAVGDMVLKDGQLYECTTAISTAEAWTSAHWTAVTVGEKIADLEAETNTLKEDLTEFGFPTDFLSVLDSKDYSGGINNSITILSDSSIASGKTITSAHFYSSSSGTGTIVLITSGLVCEKTISVTYTSGWNTIDIGYETQNEVRLGLYNFNLPYAQGKTGDYVFSASGLTTISPASPTAGTTVTTSTLYSGKFSVPFQLSVSSNLYADIITNKSDISDIQSVLSDAKNVTTFPSVYASDTYSTPFSGQSCLCSKVVPANSYIKSISFISSGAASGNIFVIRTSDNTCVWQKTVSAGSVTSGQNTIAIDYLTSAECKIGFYGLGAYYINSSVTGDYIYSKGIDVTNPLAPVVGDTISVTTYYDSSNFNISVQFNVVTNAIGAYISELEDRVTELETPKLIDHPCLISFIDDDCGVYVPTIWGSILEQAPIRMGFACVTGFISGQETGTGTYAPMTVAQLESLYADGHEVYSHSYSHPAFYSDDVTLAQISEQCRLSKQWLDTNGFSRTSDIIVYPGGLGESETDKQNVARQFYRFGIDTVGGGINPEPITNPMCIYRFNADTATLDELKAKVDDAVSEGKLLVFMNHAYELNKDAENQIAKMVALIQYIETTTAEILPFGEAIHRIYGWDYHF